MKILGISSAIDTAGVGLVENENILAELIFTGKEAQAENLIVHVKKIMGRFGSSPDGIAVTQGPGSYSSLRGGMATAKTLAQVYKIPVIGIGTLDAIAYHHIDHDGMIAAATRARADEYNFALFASSSQKLKRLTSDLVINFGKLIDKLRKINGPVILAGETEAIYRELKKKNPNTKIRGAKSNFPRPSNVAQLGIILLSSGKKPEFSRLRPKYSHQPNIKAPKKW